ncbi:MAG TPA: hypothetical protein VF701_12285 [Thermoanaerobaculia bacterium]
MIVLLAGCASGPARPDGIASPDISVNLAHPIFFGGSSTAAATIDVEIRNRAAVPITVRRVEIDSPGMVQYTLRRESRMVNQTIQPGEATTVTIAATAITRTAMPSEPLTVRTLIELRSGSSRWREIRLRSE